MIYISFLKFLTIFSPVIHEAQRPVLEILVLLRMAFLEWALDVSLLMVGFLHKLNFCIPIRFIAKNFVWLYFASRNGIFSIFLIWMYILIFSAVDVLFSVDIQNVIFNLPSTSIWGYYGFLESKRQLNHKS